MSGSARFLVVILSVAPVGSAVLMFLHAVLPLPAFVVAGLAVNFVALYVGFSWAHAAELRQKRREKGLCVRCRYDLRGTPRKCPECGTEAA